MAKTPLTDAINDSMEGSTYYPLFKYLQDNHGLLLNEIAEVAELLRDTDPINWDALEIKFYEWWQFDEGDAIFNWFKNNVKWQRHTNRG